MSASKQAEPPICSGPYRGQAWILFNEDGTPEFIDGDLTESEMRNWYRNQLKEGGYLLKCHIFEAGEREEQRHG